MLYAAKKLAYVLTRSAAVIPLRIAESGDGIPAFHVAMPGAFLILDGHRTGCQIAADAYDVEPGSGWPVKLWQVIVSHERNKGKNLDNLKEGEWVYLPNPWEAFQAFTSRAPVECFFTKQCPCGCWGRTARS